MAHAPTQSYDCLISQLRASKFLICPSFNMWMIKARIRVTLMRRCLIFLSDKTRFWYHENGEDKLWFEVGTAVVAFKAFSKASQTGT